MGTLEDRLDSKIEDCERKESRDKTAKYYIIAIFILILCGILIASYYDQLTDTLKEGKDVSLTTSEVKNIENYIEKSELTASRENIDNLKEIEELKSLIKRQNLTIEELEGTLKNYKKSDSVSLRLSYVIKPKDNYISECHSFPIGVYEIPNECKEETIKKVKEEIKSDRKIVVWEVIPIVDENPYAGLSPELKQEGLASFRAKSIVDELNNEIEGITVLKGFSVSEKNKRGYKLKAYYLE